MNRKSREEKGLDRFNIIHPLLAENLTPSEKRELRAKILLENNISERTLRRFIENYRKKKISGLIPKVRSDSGILKAAAQELIEDALSLKKELPSRSAGGIIQILKKEGKTEEGKISESTLRRIFKNYGAANMFICGKTEKGIGSRRFQRAEKGRLFQTDIKYGPYLPDPENPGKMKKTYLILFIDDATRYVAHGEFYFHQKLPILEDCFRKALLFNGLCDSVYMDNGKIFVSKWFRTACARLEIKHITAPAYSASSKGKVERFNRTVGEFLNENTLQPSKTLEELNKKFWLWLNECYHKRPHRGLEKIEGVHLSPLKAWERDPRVLKTVTAEQCRTAFLWEEKRSVDKTGCFSLHGNIFEAGSNYVKHIITVRYDPFDLSKAEIWKNNKLELTAYRLEIKEFNGVKRKKNAIESGCETSSRLLTALMKSEKEKLNRIKGCIKFRNLKKDGE